MRVEPLPNAPAATVETDGERLLAVADYHAGIEAGLRYDGVELQSAADRRRERLLSLLDRSGADRLVVLGDLGHAIGSPFDDEREELAALFDAVDVPVTLVKGNHDGDLEGILDDLAPGVEVTPGHGTRIGDVGFVHGHTWPAPDVLHAEVVCMGHEHPVVRLEDEVGGARKERAWLRGSLVADPFADHDGVAIETSADLVVFPAFNDRSGGTWVNVEGQDFLAPFLPAGMADTEAFLLDGTRLGRYRRV
ncbi:metallophosphoesterase [Haloarcula pellucida]|uniref:Phosphoesterase n=1 Tax=Haloarcula pellucida TaxID=1427151 RepID=A0A830GJD6_9EURY|nr:metallophosphoesterase [Halomicroarcula pellucida]MBX0347856.1 metallophosphoesterase [Halomicroarcula pellucida]GGN90606.1 phosphoesterase [Halomicroarcula pellucida]